MDRINKRFERKGQKRKINFREKRIYFLIVCEGTKTEPNYFKSFKKNLPSHTLDIEIIGTAKNTLSIVEETLERIKKSNKTYQSVWVVFDRDSFPEENFNSAIEKAKAKKIKCAWSNEAFELWYILHFKYLDTGISRDHYSKQIEFCLKQKIKGFRYEKNNPQMYELLKIHGKQDQAIIWAKRLEKAHTGKNHAKYNPCTLVYALVEELNNPQLVLGVE